MWYMTEEMWQFVRKQSDPEEKPGPYMTEEMWRIVRDVTDPFVLAKAIRKRTLNSYVPFEEDAWFWSQEGAQLEYLINGREWFGEGFRHFLSGRDHHYRYAKTLQESSSILEQAGKGSLAVFVFPLFGNNKADRCRITPVNSVSQLELARLMGKRNAFQCYEPFGRELLKQNEYMGTINELRDLDFFDYFYSLLGVAMADDQEIHDTIVYVIKKEFDPTCDADVLAAVREFMCALGKKVIDYEGLSSLVPATTSNEYKEYLGSGGIPNENIERYIKEREKRESSAAVRYIPTSKRMYRALRRVFLGDRVLKKNPKDVVL